MRYLTFIIAFITVFSSCSKDTEETADNHLEKWTLVKMYGSMFDSVTTEVAMEWQEYYLFNKDGTFTKSRIRNNIETKAIGTYTTIDYQYGKYLELTYLKDSEIIGSCFGNLKEVLHFKTNNILSSEWSACDGPGLEYQKVD
ncbi:hypothetical protein [Flavobacterium aestivum]|uniref:hypothetical protein n=1 Tax=Flavobacterium aestivum TaxID=3003257 RepID=UPI002285C83A|nr:hypothetical protein [Flavobacterium aestivum]